MNQVLARMLEKLRANRLVTLLLTILFSSLGVWSYYQNTLLHFAGYSLAMALGVLAVEAYALRSTSHFEWIVKDGKREVIVIGSVIFLQGAVSVSRFILYPDFSAAPLAFRLVTFGLMILVIYPVVLIIYFFFIKKYKLSEMGVRFTTGIWISVAVILIIGSITYWVAPEKIKFGAALQEYGFIQMIFLGFFSAAIPEEFARVIAQTRFAAAFNSKAFGWFLASLLWALIHIPNFYSQSNNLVYATMGAIEIMPIGLLWGYMTERLKSIWPAVFVHGTNLWGLQNM